MTSKPQASETKTYTRFDLLQRNQHIIFLISFSLLGLTGLPQKYPLAPFSAWYFNLIGGIEVSRFIHHTSAIVMMIISVIHVLDVVYRVLVLRTPISMIPWIDDLKHVIHDVQYYLGFKKHKAYYGRYSYAEKMEYLALIWGTIVMGLTRMTTTARDWTKRPSRMRRFPTPIRTFTDALEEVRRLTTLKRNNPGLQARQGGRPRFPALRGGMQVQTLTRSWGWKTRIRV